MTTHPDKAAETITPALHQSHDVQGLETEKRCPSCHLARYERSVLFCNDPFHVAHIAPAEPPKPADEDDVALAEDIASFANVVSHDGYYELDIEKITAIIARHRAASHASLRQKLQRVREVARHAHDTLIELNPSNYTHDDVCEANNATVEAIFLLADILGETHGKTAEWWAARRATLKDIGGEG